MIVGHIGAAFAARWRWPRAPFGWLLVATMAPDIARLILDLTTQAPWQRNEYSHFLPWSALLAGLLAAVCWGALRKRDAAVAVGVLVLSHIALDMISGQKPLWVRGPRGLNFEYYQQLEFVIEAGLVSSGWRLLRQSPAPLRWATSRSVLAILLVFQAVHLIGAFYARPYATRCFEYPVRPCWIRRHDRPP